MWSILHALPYKEKKWVQDPLIGMEIDFWVFQVCANTRGQQSSSDDTGVSL